jgi:capsular polysaccharide biosynthesis protein
MQTKDLSEQQGFSIFEFLQILKSKLLFIISTTILFFVLVSIYVWYIATPDYISNADVMVQVEQSASATDPNFDLVNAFVLIDTIAELMEKEIILNNAVNSLEQLGFDNLDVDYLRKGLSLKSSSTSYFINISFVDEDPILARNVVDQIIDAVIEETNVFNAFPVLTDKIRRTSFASEATYNSPNKILFSIAGLFLGTIFSVGIIFINELFSNQFKTREELEQVLDVQVLGVIPLMNFKEKKNAEKK